MTLPTLYTTLNSIPITYTKHDHPAVFTCKEAEELCSDIPGGRSKNLFLRNRKGDVHYLLVIGAEKRTDLKSLATLVDEAGLSFASEKRLMKHLTLTPGAVSPFGLVNDKAHEVIVLIDTDLMENERLSFHPNVNTATLELSSSDFRKFLEWTGNTIRFVDV
jgi:Ala-tRNA(Pro) deacylase